MSRARSAGARAQLQRELGGGELPAGLAEPEARLLLEALHATRKRHRDALRDAIDEGMRFVPALLRIPLKRILFP